MANLINGNGYTGITAQTDADLLAGLTGGVTGILPVGSKMAGSIVSNMPRIADGVILTKEGRRIQVDYGSYDDFTIPAGTAGVTSYYIIGYKLLADASDNQTCETFVQASTADGTIAESTLKEGSSEVYISLYRVIQTGADNTLSDCLLPVFSPMSSESGGDDSGGEGSQDEDGQRTIISGTKSGLKYRCVYYRGSKLVFVQLDGTLTSKLSVKNAWYTVDYEPQIKPLIELSGYAIVNSLQSLRWIWTTDGHFKIGYARSVASGETQDLANGYAVHLSFMFAADRITD